MNQWADFCSFCGERFAATAFPRTCPNGHTTYLHWHAVGVALQPVLHESELYLLVVQRGIAPFIGEYALPGGFAEPAETLRQAACRELFEETGLQHNADDFSTFWQAIGTAHPSGLDPRCQCCNSNAHP